MKPSFVSSVFKRLAPRGSRGHTAATGAPPLNQATAHLNGPSRPRSSSLPLDLLLLAGALLFFAGVIIIPAWLKAEAYNRATGAHVSWWDALILDLRVSTPASPHAP